MISLPERCWTRLIRRHLEAPFRGGQAAPARIPLASAPPAPHIPDHESARPQIDVSQLARDAPACGGIRDELRLEQLTLPEGKPPATPRGGFSFLDPSTRAAPQRSSGGAPPRDGAWGGKRCGSNGWNGRWAAATAPPSRHGFRPCRWRRRGGRRARRARRSSRTRPSSFPLGRERSCSALSIRHSGSRERPGSRRALLTQLRVSCPGCYAPAKRAVPRASRAAAYYWRSRATHSATLGTSSMLPSPCPAPQMSRQAAGRLRSPPAKFIFPLSAAGRLSGSRPAATRLGRK